jgi:hypothetical protein
VSGEHVLHGFTNRELRQKLARAAFPLAVDPAKHSAQVTRLLRRLHVHQLIAKIPRSRRWRVSLAGRRIMAAAIKLREVAYPSLYAEAACPDRGSSQNTKKLRRKNLPARSLCSPIYPTVAAHSM